MKLFTSLLALALASGAFALSHPDVDYGYRLKESIAPPRGWLKVASPPAEHILHLRIGLPHSNFDELERHLSEISDPSHSRYGQHLSKAEVEELLTPKKESLDLVDEWLASHGVGKDDCSRSSAKDWVIVKVPIRLAEKMLNTVSFLPLLVVLRT
jgi:tripeptidyl-peptidase-1